MAFSMVRKHRQMHQQRQHRRRIVSFWIQLSAPILFFLVAWYSFLPAQNETTKSAIVWKDDCVRNLLNDPKMISWMKTVFPEEEDPDQRAFMVKESLRCFHDDTAQAHVKTVWTAGSTAAAGYGNAKSQSYGELLRSRLPDLMVVDTMREHSEFPLGWCHNSSTNELVVYDFQDHVSHFDIGRLRDFIAAVVPSILVLRVELESHVNAKEIHAFLKSMQNHQNHMILYIIDVPNMGEFGVPTTPDSKHAHHLTVAQHERIADIVQLLFGYHRHTSSDDSSAVNHWQCATGFVATATTKGRTPGRLEFVDPTEISLPSVLFDCCGNEMNSVLLPHTDIRTQWVWDALHAAEVRRGLPFDRHGHDDWKLVVSGTPHSGELSIQLPVVQAEISHLRVCGDCDGMNIPSATVQKLAYGCMDILPPMATFAISVTHGACQISHFLWQTPSP